MDKDSQQRRARAIGIAADGNTCPGAQATRATTTTAAVSAMATTPKVARRAGTGGGALTRRTMPRLVVLLFVACAALTPGRPAVAELERRIVPCGEAACVWDRPKLVLPAGWAEDEDWSPRLQQIVLVPTGGDFVQAPARIIVRVFEGASAASIEELIEQEQDRALGGSLTLTAVRGAALPAADGAPWPTLVVASRDPAAATSSSPGTVSAAGFARAS